MLNLPRETINRIKTILLKQQKSVESQLKEIEKDDPVTRLDLAPEASESGTDSWMAEVHGRITTLKDDLTGLLVRIRISLSKINKGTYGKCEKCCKSIEKDRLKVLPTAILCLSCSKKVKK